MTERERAVEFAKSQGLTLGVELELQILDRQSLDLTSGAGVILAELADLEHQHRVAPEFLTSIIEIQTGVCGHVEEVAVDLESSIRRVQRAARRHGLLLYAASLHPFADPARQQLTRHPRYERIMEELQFVGRRFISQGLHVHVGVADADLAVRLCDQVQVYLPLLLALSGSSPYYQGEDTGFASYRTKLFEALPLAGIAGHLGDWANYAEEVALLREYGIIQQPRDLWWDVRPSPGFGTVEVRACDLPARFQDILVLTGLVQALIHFLEREAGHRHRPVSLQVLRSNKWQAARHGLAGRFVDPLGILRRPCQSMGKALESLLAILAPSFLDLDCEWVAEGVGSILARGTSSDRQRALYREHGDFREMIQRLQQEFWA